MGLYVFLRFGRVFPKCWRAEEVGSSGISKSNLLFLLNLFPTGFNFANEVWVGPNEELSRLGSRNEEAKQKFGAFRWLEFLSIWSVSIPDVPYSRFVLTLVGFEFLFAFQLNDALLRFIGVPGKASSVGRKTISSSCSSSSEPRISSSSSSSSSGGRVSDDLQKMNEKR